MGQFLLYLIVYVSSICMLALHPIEHGFPLFLKSNPYALLRLSYAQFFQLKVSLLSTTHKMNFNEKVRHPIFLKVQYP